MAEKVAGVIGVILMIAALFAIIFGCVAIADISDNLAIQNAHTFEDLVPYADRSPIPLTDLSLVQPNETVLIQHCYSTTSQSGTCETLTFVLNTWLGHYKTEPVVVYEYVSQKVGPYDNKLDWFDPLAITKAPSKTTLKVLGNEFASYSNGQSMDTEPNGPLVFIVSQIGK